MSLYVKNKNQKFQRNFLVIAIAAGIAFGWWLVARPSFAQSINQISVAFSLFSAENKIVTSGEYDVRFSIYRVDRTVSDPYPSNSDAGSRLWSETQKVTVKNGIMRVFLGSATPLPVDLTFQDGDYYLGVQVGTDSEMVPRKKLGAVPSAINSLNSNNARLLQGRTIGTNAGDIMVLGKSGKVDLKRLPTGTGAKQLVLGNDARFGDIHQQNTDIGTDSDIFNIGSGSGVTSGNFDLTISNSNNPPALRYNGTTQTWQVSNDGATFADVATGTSSLSGSGASGAIAYWTGASSLGSEAQLSSIRGGTGLDGSAAANGTLLIGNGAGYTLSVLSGDASITSGGVLTIGVNSVALGTDTTGNYVANVANGNGITGGSAGSEGASLSLAIDLLTSADGTGATSSNSGLEFSGGSSNQLALLQ
ncbi:MAG: hypothetical protein ABI747_00935, partial [Candidatus Moraniibacteriota bacterium]